MENDDGRVPAEVWLIWASEGSYSAYNLWPVAVSFDQQQAERFTDRVQQLWQRLCAEYKRREDELDDAGDFIGTAIFATEEGAEFTRLTGATGGLEGSEADERVYACQQVRIVPHTPGDSTP